MEKRQLNVELPAKLVDAVNKNARKLKITNVKFVELALREFIDNNPEIRIAVTYKRSPRRR